MWYISLLAVFSSCLYTELISWRGFSLLCDETKQCVPVSEFNVIFLSPLFIFAFGNSSGLSSSFCPAANCGFWFDQFPFWTDACFFVKTYSSFYFCSMFLCIFFVDHFVSFVVFRFVQLVFLKTFICLTVLFFNLFVCFLLTLTANNFSIKYVRLMTMKQNILCSILCKNINVHNAWNVTTDCLYLWLPSYVCTPVHLIVPKPKTIMRTQLLRTLTAIRCKILLATGFMKLLEERYFMSDKSPLETPFLWQYSNKLDRS